MLRFAADIHDGLTEIRESEPVLYMEWRFEGEVSGTGFFKAGIIARTNYFLVFQGLGRAATAPKISHLAI